MKATGRQPVPELSILRDHVISIGSERLKTHICVCVKYVYVC